MFFNFLFIYWLSRFLSPKRAVLIFRKLLSMTWGNVYMTKLTYLFHLMNPDRWLRQLSLQWSFQIVVEFRGPVRCSWRKRCHNLVYLYAKWRRCLKSCCRTLFTKLWILFYIIYILKNLCENRCLNTFISIKVPRNAGNTTDTFQTLKCVQWFLGVKEIVFHNICYLLRYLFTNMLNVWSL